MTGQSQPPECTQLLPGMVRVKCLHVGVQGHPTQTAASQHRENPVSVEREQAVCPTEHTTRRPWHALREASTAPRMAPSGPLLLLLGLSYRYHRFSSPPLALRLMQKEMMGRKAQYLCNDVAVLCVDLGDGTNVPDHAQDFIDLRRELGSETGTSSFLFTSTTLSPTATGARNGTHFLGASTSWCFYRPRGPCFWPAGDRAEPPVISRGRVTEQDVNWE